MFQMLLKSNQWIQLLYLGTLRACEVIIFELIWVAKLETSHVLQSNKN